MIEVNLEVWLSIAMLIILVLLYIRIRPKLKKIVEMLEDEKKRDDEEMREIIKITPTEEIKKAMEKDGRVKRWLLKNYPELVRDKLNK